MPSAVPHGSIASTVIGYLEKVGGGLIAAATALFTWRRRRRARARTQALVWDEILGHEEEPGVPFKPSMAKRMLAAETAIVDHAAADLESQRQVYAALRSLARAVGADVAEYRPPPAITSSSEEPPG